jgi:hypothetical protein
MLNKSSIAKRLALGFGVVLFLLLVVAVAGYWGMESVTRETVSMLRGDSKISQLADEAKIATLELRRYEKDTELNMTTSQSCRVIRKNGKLSWRRFVPP